jgi:hypothetical protein
MLRIMRTGARDLAQIEDAAGGRAVQCTEQANYAIDGHCGVPTRSML